MELVQGMPITKYCDREKLSIADRLQLFVQVCRALQHAHHNGIMHRDLKPSNVLVTQRDGVPVAKVIDFGLAKALQQEHRLTDKTLFTEFGQVVGTLEYMSPEQAEMNELGLETRTDVYSLGVLLYELLTGSTSLGYDRVRREAFHRVLELILVEETPRPSQRLSDSGDAITGISEQRRIEPSRLGGILEKELDWIALRALEKDRNRRYDGAGSLADDVRNYLDGDVVTARPPSTGYRLRKTVRKHKAVFVSGTVFVLLLVAGLIGTGTMWVRASTAEQLAVHEANRATDAQMAAITEAKRASKAASAAIRAQTTAEKERQQAVQQREAADTARSRAEWLVYASQISLAKREWEAGAVRNAQDVLNRCQWNLRGWEHDYLYTLLNQNQTTLTGHRGMVTSVVFSPDGAQIVSGSRRNDGSGEIKVRDASREQERPPSPATPRTAK